VPRAADAAERGEIMRNALPGGFLAACLLAAAPGVARAADLIVSSNDGHTVADAQGHLVAADPVKPDTVDLIDVSSLPPRIVSTIEAPGSVVGPPTAIWVAPDQSWAIVTSATKADPKGKLGISPDDRVSVLDLASSPPRIVQSLTSGPGAATVAVSPDRRLALITNRAAGTISVFSVQDKRLTAAGKVDTGNKESLPSGVRFMKDGRTALLTRYGDNQVNVLHINGTEVTIDKRPITTGVAPYTMDVNAAGTLAAVSNMGRGDGDVDTVSLIDLTATPMRTVETVGVPSGPEPLKFSPDGAFLAVGAQMGSNKPASDPFHHDRGVVTLFAVQGMQLRKVAQAPVGPWAEGVAFSRDGHTILVQNYGDHTISVLRWDGEHLTQKAPLAVKNAGPASFGTAWP
jgi:DNA-binding beta-propeller fold protein YncE